MLKDFCITVELSILCINLPLELVQGPADLNELA